MKVTSVDIYVPNSDNVINLSYRDPRGQNPYIAKSILGLDADDITAKFYGASSMSNDRYYELSLVKRDVIVQIALNPNFVLGKTYSDLRDDLYKLIASSRTGAIQLRFKNGNTIVAVISGFVTRFEAPQFTKSPEVQLTINCSDPMLKAADEINVDVSGLTGMSINIIDDKSTAPHGFRFGILFAGEVVDFSIQDEAIPNWAFEINLSGSPLEKFKVGDELHFSSEYNNRYLYLIRGLNIIHLVDRVIPTSVWPILFPGENHFMCSDILITGWDYITYFPTYWGV